MSAAGGVTTIVVVCILFLAGISAISEFSENANLSINNSSPFQNSLDTADKSANIGLKISSFAPLLLGAGLLIFIIKKM